MEGSEIDAALDDLETRLERLRSLYQQYFLGIEKLEPTIQRKDIDRRIWQLRRAQIRNTRKQFKFNTITQRYNTYQQYWQRILREIEAGTYQRHLQRAERRFGSEALTHTERRRRKRFRLDQDGEGAARADDAVRAAEQDLAAMLDGGVDLIEEAKRAVDDALGSAAAKDDGRQAPAPTPEPNGDRAPKRAKAPLESLDLDLDFFDAEDAPKAPAAPARGASASDPTGRAAPPPVPARGTGGAPAPRAPGTPSPARGARPPIAPSARTARSGAGRPSPAAARPPTAAAAARSPVPGGQAVGRIAQGAARAVARGQPTGQPKPPAQARPRPADGPGAVSDDRVRELYGRLVEAKRSLNQSTRSVTVDGLAKSLRATLPKLQQKHRGKNIDFDVVIKDGNAVVKPVVKK